MDKLDRMEHDSLSQITITRPPPPPPQSPHPLSHIPLTVPGMKIPTEDLSVRARGTLLSNTEKGPVLTATVSGLISRVNKLVMVTPLRARYSPETGDVVVGRIKELGGRRWRVDINSTRHAVLMLSAVNLPGGVQRRRTYEDELNMREFFREGDLLSAEVQDLWNDGSCALHTRSERYGKLIDGVFVTVQPELVKRAKKHFHELDCGVTAILGNNGYIFLGTKDLGLEGRERIARVRNSVEALDAEFVAIGPDTIMEVYRCSLDNSIAARDMLKPDVAHMISEGARSMRQAA